jgi:ribosome-binding protein aMBF1 (putative translation factor)
MAKRATHKTELIPHQRVHQRLMQDPAYARVWQETDLADQVATLLIAYRAKHGLSQTELARRLGMRQPAIARLEAGQHAPSFRTLARLAAVLEVELNLRITADGFQLTA